jgi:glutathione S-transferase
MARELYHIERCPYCEKVRLALAIEGIEYRSHVVDPDDRSEVIELSGQEKVPVLVEDDGSVLLESNRILQRLVEAPGSKLVPESRRDQSLTWVLVERADAMLAPLFYRIRRRRDPDGRELSDEDLSVLRRRLQEELAVVEGILERGPFLFGEHPTVADVAVHAFLNRLPRGERDTVTIDFPRVGGWFKRVQQVAGRS